MKTNERWLDDMQVKLSDVCKAYNWDLKQTSALAVGTRSFEVKHGSKGVTPESVVKTHRKFDFPLVLRAF